MVIASVELPDLLADLRRYLMLPSVHVAAVDVPIIAALIRRAAGILCPCSPATLASTVNESLKYLVTEPESLGEQIEEVVEGLLIAGDLLELN